MIELQANVDEKIRCCSLGACFMTGIPYVADNHVPVMILRSRFGSLSPFILGLAWSASLLGPGRCRSRSCHEPSSASLLRCFCWCSMVKRSFPSCASSDCRPWLPCLGPALLACTLKTETFALTRVSILEASLLPETLKRSVIL